MEDVLPTRICLPAVGVVRGQKDRSSARPFSVKHTAPPSFLFERPGNIFPLELKLARPDGNNDRMVVIDRFKGGGGRS